MEIFLVAAIGSERQLGLDNKLLWYLPGDLPRFKAMTMGFPVVMGRKTFDSIGKALPGRKNIVLSRNKHLDIPNVESAASVDEVLRIANAEKSQKLFVIGGGEMCQSGQGRARTADTGLFRAVLYQLSYLTKTY